MDRKQRTYKINPITVNHTKIIRAVIDPHYEKKHGNSITDDLILELIGSLDGRFELPETQKGRYSYFATLIEHKKKNYRLIWLLEEHSIYIGIINAYRDRRRN